ncbi:MAG: PAS domain S-box protein [Veillonellaceae bacterium]|nr:PAS domain S-box protein [Veillonellaceae bacterium]
MQEPVVLFQRTNARLFTLGAITLVAFVAYAWGLSGGLSVFTPLLFYFPIILAAYWFPRQGVIFAVITGILEVFLVYLFSYPDLTEITFAVTTASFYVLVAVAVVISSLSGEMRDREARYRGIFNSSEAGIFVVRNGARELIIEEANPRGSVILIEHPRDLPGKKFTEFWKDESARKYFLGVLENDGTAPQYETSIARADGTTVPVLISGARLPGHMMVLMVIDISARIAQEREIQTKNDQLELINRVTADASSASDIGWLMHSVLGHTRKFSGCDLCGAYVFHEGQPPLLFMDGDSELLKLVESSDSEISLAWRDATTKGLPLRWNGNRKVPEGLPLAGMVIPLASGEEIVGVLFFLSMKNVGAFPDQLAKSVAGEIATAVTRIHLMERLAEANRQANLYLDILMHDINNANLASLWYGDLLLEMLSGEPRIVAGKLIDGIKKSREIIRNVETIRKLHGMGTELKPVDLEAAIKKEMHLYPDISLEYTGFPVRIWADELLGEVFSNLIGNSIKFGGPNVKITIAVERTEPGKIRVIVSDTGPGIPDDLKRVIFGRFARFEPGEHSKGLGLYIVKALISRYGGDIEVSDRIAGDHAKGASFRMTLREVTGR